MTHGMLRLSTTILRHVRRGGDKEKGVALMSTILFMILLAGLSLVLLSTIIAQINTSYGSVKSTKTVNASQAGLQVALGVFRSLEGPVDPDGKRYGITSQLPCDTMSGLVDGEDSTVKYSVDVEYFLDDPTGQDASWVLNNKLTCVPGSGPMKAGISTQPKFAVVTAEGMAPSRVGVDDSAGNRTISAVYQFRVTNINIPGGRILDFNKTKCMEAEGTTVGSRIKFVAAAQCTDAKDNVQLWIYDTSYQIKLASSTVGGGDELCITDRNPSSNSNRDARLDKCLTNSSRYTQLWSWTGDHSWRGQKNPISNGVSNTCLQSAHSRLEIDDSCNGGFAPTAAVGAGPAGIGTHQIVNYLEFGRCLDVTGEDINAEFMIAYPCKQDPTSGQTYLKWNHKWYYSEPPSGQWMLANQQIYVYDSGGNKKCLESPQPGQWDNHPRFKNCSGSNAAQRWTRIQAAADYASSYVFTDFRERCLTADSSDTLDGNWSKITVATCTPSTAQKWNAPAVSNDAEFGNFKELHG